MNRREFLSTSVALGGGLTALGKNEWADLKDIKITRVVGFRHDCPRPKLVGYNSHKDVHGRLTHDQVVLIETNAGIEGVGSGRATREQARQLLGRTLDTLWKPGIGVVSPLGRADHALYDLIGQALKVPAWKLLGGKGPRTVPVYDGSIYFNDLLPEFRKKGVGQLLDEVDAGLKRGHRAFKIKVGRGFRWMEKQAGFRRDVEVVQAIRKRVGKDVKLMVDANNGYDLETTRRFLDAVDTELFFVEEMFPEEVKKDLQLKEYLARKGWKTKVADGESAREVKHFDAYLAAEALDVLQPDIRAFGLTLEWQLSRKMADKPGIKLAPHNWGSHLGLFMQLTLARGIPNFLMAEHDTSTSDLFDTSAWVIKEGAVTVPDLPGGGLVLRKEVFRKKYLPTAWVAG